MVCFFWPQVSYLEIPPYDWGQACLLFNFFLDILLRTGFCFSRCPWGGFIWGTCCFLFFFWWLHYLVWGSPLLFQTAHNVVRRFNFKVSVQLPCTLEVRYCLFLSAQFEKNKTLIFMRFSMLRVQRYNLLKVNQCVFELIVKVPQVSPIVLCECNNCVWFSFLMISSPVICQNTR